MTIEQAKELLQFVQNNPGQTTYTIEQIKRALKLVSNVWGRPIG